MNIQSLPWLKFAHDDYMFNFRLTASPLVKAAFLDLLCLSMKQTPALSIPNDDTALSSWLGLTVKRWQKIKDAVLSQFSFNQDSNRYYSPMLVELYSSPSNSTELTPHNSGELHQIKKPSSSAERVANHRARVKEEQAKAKALTEMQAVTADVTPPVTVNVTPSNVTCNADVTASNVTCNEKTLHLGGRGEILDLKLENLEKEVVVVVRETAQQTAYPTTQTAYPTTQTAYPTTTTKFSMFFDFQIQTANFDLLMQKFNVAQSKNTTDNLINFVGHYLGSSYQNTQAEWELHYVKWLKREKDKPVASVATPEATPNKTPAPLVIVDVKPLWETIAEQKEKREALPPKDAQQLAVADAAFAEMKKKLGLKAA